jgi:hypothetical protein
MNELDEVLNSIEYDYNRAIETYKNVKTEVTFVVNFMNKLLVKTQRLEMLDLDKEETKKVKNLRSKIKKSLYTMINKETEIEK